MVRIAPVRLTFNPKTLWFDGGDLPLKAGEPVVVDTARGEEFGHVAEAPFDVAWEEVKKLKSPLKAVKRQATADDVARNDEMFERSRDALPIFKRMAEESVPDMHPVAVEYLFSGDKAVFYFEAEDRVDFRDLVRRLASEFHVRVDMKQIGVRDGARLVGGIGHCGQELCCRRLGGNFNPVSIRMAKEQDLSLNPQKISGLCGRLMCCLRYEYDAYKDFHGRAPKKNAAINTPDGKGKVVDLDAVRETVSIKVEDEKPVKVPLASMDGTEEGTRPTSVGQEAWDEAQAPAVPASEVLHLFGTSQLDGNDKLAAPGQISRRSASKDDEKQKGRRRRGRGRGGAGGSTQDAKRGQGQGQQGGRNQRRRRSTTVSAEGASHTQKSVDKGSAPKRNQRRGQGAAGTGAKQGAKKGVQVGRNSSALRGGRDGQQAQGAKGGGKTPGSGQRRRRRSHKSGGNGAAGADAGGQ